VNHNVGKEEGREDPEHHEIAMVPRRGEGACEDRDQRRQEREIDERRDSARESSGKRDRHAAREPQPSHGEQGDADKRLALSPVADRSDKEAGEDGGRESEHHLVRVPVRRAEVAPGIAHADQHEQPDGKDDDRERGREQEERTESLCGERSRGSRRRGQLAVETEGRLHPHQRRSSVKNVSIGPGTCPTSTSRCIPARESASVRVRQEETAQDLPRRAKHALGAHPNVASSSSFDEAKSRCREQRHGRPPRALHPQRATWCLRQLRSDFHKRPAIEIRLEHPNEVIHGP
jgi:hypothetical protein